MRKEGRLEASHSLAAGCLGAGTGCGRWCCCWETGVGLVSPSVLAAGRALGTDLQVQSSGLHLCLRPVQNGLRPDHRPHCKASDWERGESDVTAAKQRAL